MKKMENLNWKRQDKVKFSIIVPVYNAAQTLRRCVNSIMDNSFKDLEVILIEDGSRDNSWEVCCELKKAFSNVKAIRNKENKGVSYTRNQGLKCAGGQYLLFADSDDWVESNYYEEFHRMIEKNNAELVVCGYINHDEKQNGRTDEYCWHDFEGEKCIEARQIVSSLYESCLLQQLWNKAFCSSIIREHKICFDETISIGEDLRFVLDYLNTGCVKNITLLNKTLYHYMRDQDGSLMYRVGYESIEEPLKNQEKLYQFLGLSEEEIHSRLILDRKKKLELYAYLIMHNAGMKQKEKKRLILALDSEEGYKFFKENRCIYLKEKIAKWIHRNDVL